MDLHIDVANLSWMILLEKEVPVGGKQTVKNYSNH